MKQSEETTASGRVVLCMSKTYKRICKQCGKEFEVDGKSRSMYCSSYCRGEQNKERCLRHYYNVVKPGLVKKGAIKPPPEKVIVKIKIKEPPDVFDCLMPKVGAIYTAEKVEVSRDQTIYIIREIGKYGLVIRKNECVEIGG